MIELGGLAAGSAEDSNKERVFWKKLLLWDEAGTVVLAELLAAVVVGCWVGGDGLLGKSSRRDGERDGEEF